MNKKEVQDKKWMNFVTDKLILQLFQHEYFICKITVHNCFKDRKNRKDVFCKLDINKCKKWVNKTTYICKTINSVVTSTKAVSLTARYIKANTIHL